MNHTPSDKFFKTSNLSKYSGSVSSFNAYANISSNFWTGKQKNNIVTESLPSQGLASISNNEDIFSIFTNTNEKNISNKDYSFSIDELNIHTTPGYSGNI